jgi:hypothetical protein
MMQNIRAHKHEDTEAEAKAREQRDRVAQWAFDTRPILSRLHLWLENVEVEWLRGGPKPVGISEISFMSDAMERQMEMAAGVTALGTILFGRFGKGKGKGKAELNQVKKDADAISAYVLAESLWYASRQLPENHAIMVSLGEGLMPKAGETPEMGSNPQLGFGRIYARPQVAQWLEERVARMLNDPEYRWERFYEDVKTAGITVWGAAIDTLENTSRFAKGHPTGPMTVLHLFDHPLRINRPYEGYMGTLFLPRDVVDRAAEHSTLIDFRTPRATVMDAIEATYPGIRREHVHVWTLGGKSRSSRIGKLWKEWQDAGAHIVEDGWKLPTDMEAFTDSGTYAPTYLVGTWRDEDDRVQLFLIDGYAASAEAMQAASLAPMLKLKESLAVFTSRFELGYDRERLVMHLDPEAPDFPQRLGAIMEKSVDEATIEDYRDMIREARDAGLPLDEPVMGVDDFFPEKQWEVLALCGYMQPDPYSGAPGVEEVAPDTYRTTVRAATAQGGKRITFTLRLMEPSNVSRLVFNPLLIRFFSGEDFARRAVRISDSGRIRNELQTLCSEAVEHGQDGKLHVHFDRIPDDVISPENQQILLDVLLWYKEHHPFWFRWLEVVEPREEF